MRRRPVLLALCAAAVAAGLVPPAAAAPVQVAPTRSAAVLLPTAGPGPVVRSVGVGSNPIDVEIAQARGVAYVLNDGSVSVVSLTTKKELAEYSTGGLHGQNALALVRSQRWGYVTNLNRTDVTIFSTVTQNVIGHIPLGAPAFDVVRTRAAVGERAYVALNNGRVLGISTLRSKVVQRTVLPQPAQTLGARPGGREIWAAGINSGRIYVISTATGRVTATIRINAVGPASSISFTADGRTAWVAGEAGVTAINASTRRSRLFVPITRIFSGFPNMGNIAPTASGRFALVQNSTFPDAPGRGTVALIRASSGAIVWRAPVGIEPIGMAIDPVRSTAYVPNYADDTLSYLAVPR